MSSSVSRLPIRTQQLFEEISKKMRCQRADYVIWGEAEKLSKPFAMTLSRSEFYRESVSNVFLRYFAFSKTFSFDSQTYYTIEQFEKVLKMIAFI